MNATVFIASPLVGAGIGYLTNWIAIKMLFRPLQPMRIMGKEIPALQGVIPKRHKDLAKSIGQTVGEHLLTEDAFESIFQSAETREQVRLLVREAAKALQHEERSIDDLVALALPDVEKREAIHGQVSAWITSWILDVLRSEKTLDALQQMVEDFLHKGMNEFVDSDDYAKLKFTIREYILVQLRDPAVAEQLTGWLTAQVEDWKQREQTLHDLIPTEVVEKIKGFLDAQGPEISQQLISFLDTPETRAQMGGKIEQFFQRGFWMSMLGKLFADKDKITDQIIDQVAGFLQEPGNQAVIVEKINGVLDQMLATPVGDLARRVDGELITSVSGWLYEKITAPTFVDTLLDHLEELVLRKMPVNTEANALRATTSPVVQQMEVLPEEIIPGQDTESSQAAIDLKTACREVAITNEYSASQSAVGSLIRQVLTSVLQADFVAEGVARLVHGQVQSFRQRSVKSFFVRLQMSVVAKAEDSVLGLLDYVHRNYLGRILTVLNFERLVEDKILSFDLEEMEAIVLEVMSVELKAVTNFGLYLGFLMGFLTPLFNLIIGG